MGGGQSGGSKSPGPAAQALSSISREQFADWMKRYRPQTSALAAEVNNPLTLSRNLAMASRTVGTQFGLGKANTARNLSRLGVVATPEQQASMDRQGALAEAGMNAAVRTGVRQAMRDRDTQIIGGL